MRPDRIMTPADIERRDHRLSQAVKAGVPVRKAAAQAKIDYRKAMQICLERGVEPPAPRKRSWL